MWIRFLVVGFFSVTAIVLSCLQVIEFSGAFIQFIIDLFETKN